MTVTQKAIETAIRNGEKMHGVYDCDPFPGIPGMFYVQHKEQVNRCYIVDTRAGKERCQCEAWKRSGVCKHEWFAREMQRIAEGEEMAEGAM